MTLKEINKELEPLSERAIQAYFGSGLHTLGLLHWILSQTGRADVWMSSYSTSEQFLNGFALLKAKGLVKGSMLVLDQRAAKKTVKLQMLLRNAFDHVFLGQNHSKLILVYNKNWLVAAVTSQNQTYGARAESTMITTDRHVFFQLMGQFQNEAGENSVELDIYSGKGIITGGGAAGKAFDYTKPDWRPFGIEA